MKAIYKSIISAFCLAGLVACSYEEPGDRLSGAPLPLQIDAHITGSGRTRAVINDSVGADRWSYVDFEPGDEMGFFSSGGNYTDGTYGEAPFINQKLIYTGGEGGDNFRDPNNTMFSPTHMKGSEIFMYYPYNANIDTDKGVILRTNDGRNGEKLDTARCIDFLSTDYLSIYSENNSSKAALYGEFKHTFAELIIMRGKGFDDPPEIEGKNRWSIKAVLNTPITGLRTVTNEPGQPWKCTPTLVWDSISVPDRTTAQSWDAWQGRNFYLTEQDTTGQIAWYVIVPTIGCEAKVGEKRNGPRTIVEYIELYDNDGNLQRVSSLLLSNSNSKYVDGGWRYPMQITMEELVPTANPCAIIPWGEDVDLTDARSRGINNENDFYNWITDYNYYLTNPADDRNIDNLLKYGDLYENPDGKLYWHFYVLSNLNLAAYSQPGVPVVKELRDILDGQSTTLKNGKFVNYQITSLNSPLIGTLTGGNAALENFTLVRPEVEFTNGDIAPAGIVANSMAEGASIVNCVIQQGTLYHPDGPAGIFTGSISGGLIKDCTASGSVFSQSTDSNKMAGEVSGSSVFDNNNVTNVNVYH